MRKKTKDDSLKFGKRGREQAEPAKAAAMSMQRLMQIGARWWGGKKQPKKKDPRGPGFKRSRLDT